MRIFVYGTLLRSLERYNVLKNCLYCGPAAIEAKLYDFGSYPGIREGKGITLGEIYEIDDQVLKLLDSIEGFKESDLMSSLYLGIKINAKEFSNGNYTEVLTYFANTSFENEVFISHGDYRRYRMEKNDGLQWVLAYGSNIKYQRLKERVGDPLSSVKGHIPGYDLLFNKKASKNDTAYANIKFIGNEGKCPAIAWKLTTEQTKALDGYEGTPNHYLRISIPFQPDEGDEMITQAYIAHFNQLVSGRKVSSKYAGFVRDGYKEAEFEKNYLHNALKGGLHTKPKNSRKKLESLI